MGCSSSTLIEPTQSTIKKGMIENPNDKPLRERTISEKSRHPIRRRSSVSNDEARIIRMYKNFKDNPNFSISKISVFGIWNRLQRGDLLKGFFFVNLIDDSDKDFEDYGFLYRFSDLIKVFNVEDFDGIIDLKAFLNFKSAVFVFSSRYKLLERVLKSCYTTYADLRVYLFDLTSMRLSDSELSMVKFLNGYNHYSSSSNISPFVLLPTRLLSKDLDSLVFLDFIDISSKGNKINTGKIFKLTQNPLLKSLNISLVWKILKAEDSKETRDLTIKTSSEYLRELTIEDRFSNLCINLEDNLIYDHLSEIASILKEDNQASVLVVIDQSIKQENWCYIVLILICYITKRDLSTVKEFSNVFLSYWLKDFNELLCNRFNDCVEILSEYLGEQYYVEPLIKKEILTKVRGFFKVFVDYSESYSYAERHF